MFENWTFPKSWPTVKKTFVQTTNKIWNLVIRTCHMVLGIYRQKLNITFLLDRLRAQTTKIHAMQHLIGAKTGKPLNVLKNTITTEKSFKKWHPMSIRLLQIFSKETRLSPSRLSEQNAQDEAPSKTARCCHVLFTCLIGPPSSSLDASLVFNHQCFYVLYNLTQFPC